MKVIEYLQSFTHSPAIHKVTFKKEIWYSLVASLMEEHKTDINSRKDFWDWCGKDISDEHALNTIRWMIENKSICLNGPYRLVRFECEV